MEFIFQNFEANLALVNEEHCGNLKYWDDAQREVKQCINNISSFKQDQQMLHIIRWDLGKVSSENYSFNLKWR